MKTNRIRYRAFHPYRLFERKTRSEKKWLPQQQHHEVVAKVAIVNRNPLAQVDFRTIVAKGDCHHDYSGVLFSVPRFHRYIKKSTPKSRVTMAAAVYTAAVVCELFNFASFPFPQFRLNISLLKCLNCRAMQRKIIRSNVSMLDTSSWL